MAEAIGGVDLVVFVHGLWGGPSNWNSVVRGMRHDAMSYRPHPSIDNRNNPNLAMLVSSRNASTPLDLHEGVDIAGSRLVEEVTSAVDIIHGKKLNSDELILLMDEGLVGSRVRSLSFVAHSLGGLLSRFAMRHLYDGESSKTFFGGRELFSFLFFPAISLYS